MVDAPPDEVAAELRDTIDVVERRPDRWLLQQERGRPEVGWNGSIHEVDGRAELVAVFGNVEPDPDGHVAWQQICPDGPTAGG